MEQMRVGAEGESLVRMTQDRAYFLHVLTGRDLATCEVVAKAMDAIARNPRRLAYWRPKAFADVLRVQWPPGS